MTQDTLDKPQAAEAAGTSTPPAVHPITVVVNVRLQALAIPEPKGGYSVVVPALPGCVTMGETIEEVQSMVVDAAEGWLEVAHEQFKDEAARVALV